ncbi:uncharacterized protein SCHCODRAFT_02614781 [Schizophyllum commune H4-8]|uniref:uncharacterized protein n=1 Tax=Schizophyllum commune (strain H4-8 / FGSC 9210) TaxID=578458 RepID=UPI002160E2DF|nr:uncharacterized protein SCHCODRAFT_02614781 [Schizophyllum commune H4-8]KAI5896413.1 hypothetical protein SCHCODRAFT_02614781 [Schizophyllum commune H4-8]
MPSSRSSRPQHRSSSPSRSTSERRRANSSGSPHSSRSQGEQRRASRSRSRSRTPRRPRQDEAEENRSNDRTSGSGKRVRSASASSSEAEILDPKRFKLDSKTHNRYKDLGRIFGRDCEMWVPPLDVIRVGMARDPNHDPALFSLEDNLLYNAFLRLAQTAPDVIDHLNEINMQAEPRRGNTLRAISRSINQGRKGARGDDVKSCKAALRDWVCDWVPPLPTKKSKAGFSHEKTGKLLSPVRQVWNEDTRIKCLNHEIDCSPDALCRLLFANEEDDTVGFLKHELLVKCYKHIFTGPTSAVQSESSGRTDTNGKRHGITTVSIPAIAYCAVLVHFCLSSQTSMGQGSPTNGYQYGRMYRLILEICEGLGVSDRNALLAWWNQKAYIEHHRPVHDSAAQDLLSRFQMRANADNPSDETSAHC